MPRHSKRAAGLGPIKARTKIYNLQRDGRMERNLTMIALFAALIAALGLIPALTLGFGVPITAQTLGVMLCGTILGAKRGALAALLFVALLRWTMACTSLSWRLAASVALVNVVTTL